MNRRLLALLAATALVASGCTSSPAAEQPAVSAPGSQSRLDDVLATHELKGLDSVELVNRLDRLGGDDRPDELIASVLPAEVVLTADGQERSQPLPADRFYLSVAPYVNRTHDCFNHSLTTCTGELSETSLEIEVTDRDSGAVLMDETRSTFVNGFVGLWLPRDIEATLTITSELGTGSVDFNTLPEAPTCLTTLRLT